MSTEAKDEEEYKGIRPAPGISCLSRPFRKPTILNNKWRNRFHHLRSAAMHSIISFRYYFGYPQSKYFDLENKGRPSNDALEVFRPMVRKWFETSI
jgi:hypothetical protein